MTGETGEYVDPDEAYLAEWDAEREEHQLPDGSYLDPAEEFWGARPELEHILGTARALRAGPWATLGVVLARVVAQTPPHVLLPGRGSLNLFLGMIGQSGQGKGRATDAAEQAMRFPHTDFVTAGLGSGEGLAHLYAKRVGAPGQRTVEMHTKAVLLDVAEVDTIAALGQRSSATILPELRKGWSGERLGFSYADPDKRLPIDAQSYRLCLTVGIQPKRAGSLLDDSDGGTPQRFIWLPVIDPYAPDAAPTAPDPWEWKVPAAAQDHGWKINRDARTDEEQLSLVVLEVCGKALRELDAFRLASLRGEARGEELDAHAMFSRLKIGAALGLLAGHLGVTEEDWQLAGLIKEQSDRQRESVKRAIQQVADERNRAQGRMEGVRATVAAEIAEKAATDRVAKTLHRRLKRVDGDGWISHSALRRTLAGRDRVHFDAAIADLIRTGDARIEDVDDGFRYHSA